MWIRVINFAEVLVACVFGLGLVGLITFSSPETRIIWITITGLSFVIYLALAAVKRSIRNADDAILFHSSLDED